MENADPAVKQLAKIAYDEKVPVETRLKATLALIDRAGLTPRAALDVEVGPSRPYQQILEHIESGSRAAYRASADRPDPKPNALVDSRGALPALDNELVLDAEIVGSGAELLAATRCSAHVDDYGQSNAPPGDEGAGADDTVPESMPLVDAVQLQRRMRRQAAQRALPPRWSR